MTGSIYREIKGQGHNVVLLHGWGMHGGLWGKFGELLSEHYQVHALDFPGFGHSHKVKNDFTLSSFTQIVEEYINKLASPVILIGWSLGGLIALNILKKNNIHIDKVIFIATTPSFTKKEGWSSAMEPALFNAFADELKLDYIKTLKRFLSLQSRGSELSRDELRKINHKLLERGEPQVKALEGGLHILSDTDLRCTEPNNIPAMIVLGARDTLVPLSVKGEFMKMFPNLTELVLEKTGHVPFMSKPIICAEKIKNFINE